MSNIPLSITSNSSRGRVSWSNELSWYPNSRHYTPDHAYTFEETEKNLFFQNCIYNLSEERVYSLEFFKTPLSKDHIKRAPPGYQYKLVHVYVLASCARTWFCFAKTCSDIDVICAHRSDENSLHENQYQPNAPSRTHTRVAASGPRMVTIRDIIEWIFDSGQITSGYNSFTNNCKDFAVALFNNFTPCCNNIAPTYFPVAGHGSADKMF